VHGGRSGLQRSVALASAKLVVLALAGCAATTARSGPVLAALVVTWSCDVGGADGERVGSIDDGVDPAFWYDGGDHYRIEVERGTWKLSGERRGKAVSASGHWGKEPLLWAPARQSIEYQFTAAHRRCPSRSGRA